MAVVAAAVIRIGQKALKNTVMWGIAAAAFVAIFFLAAPFPAIVAGAALLGWLGHRTWRGIFRAGGGHGPKPNPGAGGTAAAAAVIDDSHEAPLHTRPTWARAARVVVVGLVLWWTPVLLAGAWHGWDGTLFREGVFFSKAAMVTFGGAYAVLPYVGQQAVENHAWLSAPQMMDAIAFAETTPGPLIMVLQHVGFMGGWHQPGALPPLTAAFLGALLTTWVTFVPCFLWIFLGAPHIEQMRGQARFNAALTAVTAAVVGVILNLAVWFGWHVVRPEPGRVDWFALALSLVAFIALQRFKANMIAVILASGGVGLAGYWLRGV
jgi:chromate transporter